MEKEDFVMNVSYIKFILNTSNANFDNDTYSGSRQPAHSLLDQYNHEIFITKLPAIVYTSLMMLLGIPGNIIVLYIYFFKWRRSTSRMFILFLAALDIINCSTTLPMEIYIMRNSLKLDQPLLCKLSRFSTYVMNCSSALVLVGIATDRFKRICRPYQRAFSETQSRHISLAAILFSMATTWPSLILYGTRTVQVGNVTGSACLLENKYDATPYPLIYFSFMITSTMITFGVLITLYYLVGLQIYKHRKFKLKNCTHVQKIIDEKSVTIKSEKSNGEKLKTSTNDANNAEEEPSVHENNVVVHVVVNEESATHHADNEDELKPYQLGLPPPCKDVETSCGLLDLPYQGNAGHHGSDLNISDVTRETSAHSVNDLKVDEVQVTIPRRQTNQRTNPKVKVKKKRRRVRYLLVRGSSTLNASGRAKCINCLTVKIGRSTLMLFIITIAYVISFLPFYILAIVRQSNSDILNRMSKPGLAAFNVCLRSYLLSSVINPFIYSFCNAQFRDYCKETFFRLFLGRQHYVRGNVRYFGRKQ